MSHAGALALAETARVAGLDRGLARALSPWRKPMAFHDPGKIVLDLSPLLANIALSVLDEHVHAPWRPGGAMSTSMRRQTRRKKGLPNWRIVRYADDFVILVHGTEHDVHALREDVAAVLAPMGLRLSAAKTSVRHFSDGFDFLGFHIQWRRKTGTNK